MFPYAYYRAYFDGPLHGHSFRGKALYIEPDNDLLDAGGTVDIEKVSHVRVDTSAGDVVINGFSNSMNGQMLFIHKVTTANSLIFVSEEAGATEKIYTSNRQDLAFGAGQYGGAIFICVEDGGVFSWHQLDSNGLIADGTESLPSLAFASDPDTGFYRKADNRIGVTTSGVDRLIVGSDYISSRVKHYFTDGSETFPALAFSDSVTTGLYRNGLGEIALTVGGVNALSVLVDGFNNDSPFIFTNGGAAQRIYTGGLLSSDNFTDASLIPTNGIYSKGDIRTDGQFLGTATSALYADLAERYAADKEYKPGTVVILGGEKEITVTDDACDPRVFGVISANPAFKMNDKPGMNNGLNPFVALAGRVPCKVFGKVKKGDRLVTINKHGVAASVQDGLSTEPYAILGRALESKDSDGVSLIEIVVGRL